KPFVVITPTSLDAAQGAAGNAGVLDFANQKNGVKSETQTLTIANTGGADLNIKSADVMGLSSAFTVKNESDCTSNPIAAGSSCALKVMFKSSAAGPQEGTLEITDDADGSPRDVSLIGTGTKDPLSHAMVDASEGSVYNVDCSKVKKWGWHLIH